MLSAERAEANKILISLGIKPESFKYLNALETNIQVWNKQKKNVELEACKWLAPRLRKDFDDAKMRFQRGYDKTSAEVQKVAGPLLRVELRLAEFNESEGLKAKKPEGAIGEIIAEARKRVPKRALPTEEKREVERPKVAESPAKYEFEPEQVSMTRSQALHREMESDERRAIALRVQNERYPETPKIWDDFVADAKELASKKGIVQIEGQGITEEYASAVRQLAQRLLKSTKGSRSEESLERAVASMERGAEQAEQRAVFAKAREEKERVKLSEVNAYTLIVQTPGKKQAEFDVTVKGPLPGLPSFFFKSLEGVPADKQVAWLKERGLEVQGGQKAIDAIASYAGEPEASFRFERKK